MSEVSTRSFLGPSLFSSTLAAVVVGAVPLLASRGSALSTWLLGAASAALLLGPAALGCVADGARNARGFWSVAVGFGLSLTPLMLLGGLLKTATHHRPLGAATFAIIASLVVLGSIVFCWRLAALAEGAKKARGRWIRSVVGGAALVSGGWVLLALLRLATSIDFVIAYAQLASLIAALWLVSHEAVRKKLAKLPAIVGIVAWLSIVLAGTMVAATSPSGAVGATTTAILWHLFAS